MSDGVQFDEDDVGMPRFRPGQAGSHSSSINSFSRASTPPPKGLIGWLIKLGLINSDSGARAILVAIVSINFIATALIIYFFILR